MAIHIKKSRRGSFRRYTKTKPGQKIPESKIEAGLHSRDRRIRKKANFAKVARKWAH
jgi:hypothetical protein